MKKGKPAFLVKQYLFIFIALLLGIFLGRFISVSAPQTQNIYQCPENIPEFPWDEPVDRDLVIQTLGFDNAQLLEGMYYDEFLGNSFLLDCSIVNGQPYIVLVYRAGEYGTQHRLQFIHFEDNLPILYSYDNGFPAIWFDRISYMDEDHNYVEMSIITDRNQNGLPDATLIGGTGGSHGTEEVWMLEFYPDGSAINLVPEPIAIDWHLEDVNGDGIPDWQATDNNYFMTGSYNPMPISSTWVWNGSAYILFAMNIDGIDSRSAANLVLQEYSASPQSICTAIQSGDDTDGIYGANGVTRHFFAIIYFYEHLLHEREQAWEMIQPLVDEAANCPYDPSLPDFWADMSKIYDYFEGN
jgi:hypothetical protein